MFDPLTLQFSISGEALVIRELVEVVNESPELELLTVTDGSVDRKLVGPVKMTVAIGDVYEHYLVKKPADLTLEHMLEWLDIKSREEGWEMISDQAEYAIMRKKV